jgi:hypothetical protein
MKTTGETSLVLMERAAILLAEANTIQKAKELKTLALTAADWARLWAPVGGAYAKDFTPSCINERAPVDQNHEIQVGTHEERPPVCRLQTLL